MGIVEVVACTACSEKSAQQVAFAWSSGKFCLFRRGTVPAAMEWQLGGAGVIPTSPVGFRVDEERFDDFILGSITESGKFFFDAVGYYSRWKVRWLMCICSIVVLVEAKAIVDGIGCRRQNRCFIKVFT